MKVLVADDDAAVRQIISFLITPFSFQIFEARDGKEALSIAEREAPEFIITDVDMPFITGFDLCKRIKDSRPGQFTYVIIVTGSSLSSEDRETAFDSGADDYVCKPFDKKEFVGRIKAGLRIKTLHDQVFRLSVTDG